jgi:predicted nucleotidyltransferase
MLRRWRSVVKVLASVVRRLYPGSRVYVFGGAAEGRLTVLSDIDVLVVLDRPVTVEERVEVLARIWEELERAGVPAYYPLEIHVVGPDALEEYRRRGARLVDVDSL